MILGDPCFFGDPWNTLLMGDGVQVSISLAGESSSILGWQTFRREDLMKILWQLY